MQDPTLKIGDIVFAEGKKIGSQTTLIWFKLKWYYNIAKALGHEKQDQIYIVSL